MWPDAFSLSQAKNLHDLLLAGVLPDVIESDRVIIVPDEAKYPQLSSGASLLCAARGKTRKALAYICSSPTLITRPKTFHIRIISTIFFGKPISCLFGKLPSIHPFLFPPQFFCQLARLYARGGMTCGLRLPPGALLFQQNFCHHAFCKTILLSKEENFLG
jgi:hypothetical protein